jgi:DNA primase
MRPDILGVAAEAGVDLQVSGNLYKACCPFHLNLKGGKEKVASCFFYPDTNSFYCFGCGAGGDVIEFVKLINGISYTEAVRTLGIEEDQFSTNILRSKLQGVPSEEIQSLLNKYYLLGNKLLYSKKLSISKEAKLFDKYYESSDLTSLKNFIKTSLP